MLIKNICTRPVKNIYNATVNSNTNTNMAMWFYFHITTKTVEIRKKEVYSR